MSFSVDASKFASKAANNLEHARRAIALKLFGSVIKDTPVLTGRLRGNWQCSLESPLTGEIPVRSGAAAVAEVATTVDGAKGTDKPLFLRNNLPYAARIEFDGWSHTKAPEGMVRKNVARISRIIAESVREGSK